MVVHLTFQMLTVAAPINPLGQSATASVSLATGLTEVHRNSWSASQLAGDHQGMTSILVVSLAYIICNSSWLIMVFVCMKFNVSANKVQFLMIGNGLGPVAVVILQKRRCFAMVLPLKCHASSIKLFKEHCSVLGTVGNGLSSLNASSD